MRISATVDAMRRSRRRWLAFAIAFVFAAAGMTVAVVKASATGHRQADPERCIPPTGAASLAPDGWCISRGSTGAIGPVGPADAHGLAGACPVERPTGARGATGSGCGMDATGAGSAAGPDGPTGEAIGPTGVEGPTGLQGPTGNPWGYEGPTGVVHTTWYDHLPGEGSRAIRSRLLSAAGLAEVSQVIGTPVYWAGPRERYSYEFRRTVDGDVYVRYLPAGAPVGASGEFLVVATYPVLGALPRLRAQAEAAGASTIAGPDGSVALISAKRPRDVYLAFPDVPYEIEIFSPMPAEALALAKSGDIPPVG